jgi:hypothetical protein
MPNATALQNKNRAGRATCQKAARPSCSCNTCQRSSRILRYRRPRLRWGPTSNSYVIAMGRKWLGIALYQLSSWRTVPCERWHLCGILVADRGCPIAVMGGRFLLKTDVPKPARWEPMTASGRIRVMAHAAPGNIRYSQTNITLSLFDNFDLLGPSAAGQSTDGEERHFRLATAGSSPGSPERIPTEA